ncbi:hypothetical protein C7B65_05100 [Phormidesmis priestleyi ULC007]|uniref:Uncharacterized protein n=1 Tax=Phormidesmis priestleyi ULC007 TaxID=1920490 RepID=A0A2T1DLD3_9CYAN|nr:hypothetical protein [Phormidesmis priestleyi]PSB21308.1 hypothetical protein C7B65_05100 [Phormidesmis priestleyi ULC007]PZO50679.1 MAG: hypothetical protein DCF14_11045 [Phormidesmis priestleyi]
MTDSADQLGAPNQVCLPCQTIAQPFPPTAEVTKMEDYPTQEPPTQAKKQAGVREERPTFEPPVAGAIAQGNTAWQSDKKVVGLWMNSATRNAYMYVDQVGWRKFADNSDSAIVAFNVIAAHAKALGKPVQYYEEADNKVSTLYVW